MRTTRWPAVAVTALALMAVAGSGSALTVTVANVNANPGQSGVAVSIAVDNAQGIAGGDLLLKYDTKVLTAREAKGTDLLGGAGIMAIANLATAGQVQIAMAGASGIASGSGPIVTVTFDVKAGAAAGSYSLDLQASLWDENGMPLSATPLKGSFTVKDATSPPAVLALSAASLAMDSTKVGSTTRKALALTNNGTGNLTVSGITVEGTDAAVFRVTPTQFTVAAKGTKQITVSFSPTSAGNKTASLSIAHSGSGGPAKVSLSGKGFVAAAVTASPSSLALDSVKVGSTARKTLTLTNNGTGTVAISNIAVNGTDAAMFKVTPTQFTLAAKGTKQVTVSFTPTSAGNKTASLSIIHTGSGSPAAVPLTGKGLVAAVLTVSPSSLALDSAKVGATTRRTLTLTNNGTGSLAVSGITVGGVDAAMFKAAPTQFTLAARGSRQVTVSFTPTAAGTKAASLSIVHTGSGSPASVALSGKGYQPQPEGLQVSVGSATGSPGGTVTVPVSVNQAKGIAGGDLSVTYDPAVLKATQVKATDLLTSASITAIPNLSSAGEVRMAMAGAAGIPSGNGPLLQITFDVLASATPGTYELGLAAALWDESGMAMPATVARGSVTVKAKSGKAAGEGVLSLGMAPSYPNPFNSTTVIPYQVAQPGHVRLAIYNLAGQRVRLLVDGAAEPGSYLAVWNGLDELGREAGTGTYLCALQAGTGRATRALLLMR